MGLSLAELHKSSHSSWHTFVTFIAIEKASIVGALLTNTQLWMPTLIAVMVA